MSLYLCITAMISMFDKGPVMTHNGIVPVTETPR
jgi:hypothetical protein